MSGEKYQSIHSKSLMWFGGRRGTAGLQEKGLENKAVLRIPTGMNDYIYLKIRSVCACIQKEIWGKKELEFIKKWRRKKVEGAKYRLIWRRKWQPTPVFLPGESQGRGSLVGCRLWGRPESDTTEATQQQQ